jgi:hypothetical protein
VDGSGPLHQKNHCSNVPFGINRWIWSQNYWGRSIILSSSICFWTSDASLWKVWRLSGIVRSIIGGLRNMRKLFATGLEIFPVHIPLIHRMILSPHF